MGNIVVVPQDALYPLRGGASTGTTQRAVSREAVLLYLDTLEAAGRSPYTIADYRRRLLPFVHRLDGRLPTGLDVRDYLDTHRSTNHRSVTLVVLRQWFKFLYKRGLMNEDPSEGIPLPKRRRRNYPPVSPEEFDLLVEALPTEDLRVLSFILYRVGSRISEALAIRAEDVAFEADGYGTIEFPHRKGEIDGFASFGPDVCSILRPFLQGKRGPLWPFLTRVGTEQYLRRAGVKAGIPGTVTPHRLRHQFITSCVDGGWNQIALQRQVGHSNPMSTAWYCRVTRKGLVNAYRQFDRGTQGT